MSTTLVIFLHSAEYDRVYQAVNMLQTASSMGRECYLFLFYQALASFMTDSWDKTPVSGPTGADGTNNEWTAKLERAFESANTPPLREILEKARKAPGGVTVCACSTSARLLGFESAEVKAKVDEIVGLATMLEVSSNGGQILYI